MLHHKRFSYFFLLLIFAACQPGGPKEAVDSGEVITTAFVANPQRVAEQPVPTLAIGEPAPDFRLPGVDGKYYSLSDFAEAKVLCIIFTCNHCPTAQAYEERIKAIVNDYREAGVAVVAISPNSPVSLLLEELGYTDLNDDFEAMIIRAREQNFNFPYLYDGDTHTASIPYGPVATPHAFVFDSDRRLHYTGRLDASEKPGTANAEDLRAALDAVLAGEEVAVPVTKTFGCSVKWAWKDEYKKKVEADWKARPVTLEDIDVEGLQELLRNEDSGKLRLLNVWATWCGPCIIEYPEFLDMQRMYGARDFEFVSLSADKPEQRDKVLRFLKEKESGVTNYLFANDDKYALIEAIDREWDGALPYTVLVAPGGEIVYRRMGSIDALELKQAIVEHPLMGRYY